MQRGQLISGVLIEMSSEFSRTLHHPIVWQGNSYSLISIRLKIENGNDVSSQCIPPRCRRLFLSLSSNFIFEENKRNALFLFQTSDKQLRRLSIRSKNSVKQINESPLITHQYTHQVNMSISLKFFVSTQTDRKSYMRTVQDYRSRSEIFELSVRYDWNIIMVESMMIKAFHNTMPRHSRRRSNKLPLTEPEIH